MDVDFLADPYPTYAWLRDEEPVHHHLGSDRTPPFWALSRFEDIWTSVRQADAFSSAQGLTFFPDEIATLGLPPNIVMVDAPQHTRLRGLIGRGFTPRQVTRLEDAIRRFAGERLDEIADRAAAGETIDLHEDYSATVPTFVLAELFGVPEPDRVRFGPWVKHVTALQDQTLNGGGLDDPEQADGIGAVAELLGYFSEVIAERRASGGTDDLIGALVAAELDGERLTDWDILGFCFVVTAGGSDTTAALISHAVMLLDQAPEQRKLLLDDPGLLSPAIQEFLRLESSVQGLARTTTRDVTIRGTTIPAGEKVLMLYGAGNRDPREFGPNADALDVRREFTRHLAFSSGPHFCIGTHLARLQARVALEELLARYPDVSVDPAAGVRHPSAFVRGWLSLPASLHG
ncbi:cytochrome P450 [Nocardioides marmoriginsengisoli]|uniref:Cytochrome P450 n=1 Tax=Nocardioides marmoriginsengisoli TaxID=661483 RepID=A0A3N0CJW7_9ACTN|nr:cytochrome P450 [Nocardioides marmoriginsengisoli]